MTEDRRLHLGARLHAPREDAPPAEREEASYAAGQTDLLPVGIAGRGPTSDPGVRYSPRRDLARRPVRNLSAPFTRTSELLPTD